MKTKGEHKIKTKEENPVCSPLLTFEDVINWNCKDICWAENVCKISSRTSHCYSNYGQLKCSDVDVLLPKPSVKHLAVNVPKTLVCHDMKGGYLDDRFVNDTQVSDPYRFFHWSSIDIFVYFSHYFVTIPPVGWINCGHLHGVPVLGTLITENDAGIKLCDEILQSEDRTRLFSRKLAELCQHYGFDGYLLNIENKIEESLVPALINFVKMLKTDLTEICSDRNTYLIWYDSVISPSGKLKWQNKLNSLNKCFFDACDGIFLNYCWKDEDLRESVECAGARLKDVYVGVDVFGRNCYGGGGFNCDKALELIRSYGLSAAIFAPGWTHECQTEQEKDDFIHREYNFWSKIWQFLYCHGYSSLPFRTTFCQGYGEKMFKEGDVHSEIPWFNLRKQNIQPTCNTCCETIDNPCVSLCTEEAYEGGSCIKISPCKSNVIHRLLACDFGSELEKSRYVITVAYKFLQNEGKFGLSVIAEDKHKLDVNFSRCSTVVSEVFDGRMTFTVVAYNEDRGNEVQVWNLPERFQDYPNGWHVRTIELKNEGALSLREFCVSVKDCPVLLGLLEVVCDNPTTIGDDH